MDKNVELGKRTEFQNLLLHLASQDPIELHSNLEKRVDYYRKLEDLYTISGQKEPYRHLYSDIFAVLMMVKQDEQRGSMMVLGNNIEFLYHMYCEERVGLYPSKIDISDSLRKLWDHVNLDIARIDYSDGGDREMIENPEAAERKSELANLKRELRQMQEQMQEFVRSESDLGIKVGDTRQSVNQLQSDIDQAKRLSSQMDETKTLLEKLKDELADSKKEYITILGIFASIVLTLTAGITFSTSVLQNIDKASIYRLAGIVVLVGLVLLNILFVLVHYIDKLLHGKPKESFTPLVVANAILAFVLFFIFIAWTNGVVESRDKEIEKSYEIVLDMTDEEGSENP